MRHSEPLRSALLNGGRQLQEGSSNSWARYTIAQLTADSLTCMPRDAFIALSFEHARMVRSNLGGRGGRCRDTTYADGTTVAWSDLCEEQCDVARLSVRLRALRTRRFLACGCAALGSLIDTTLRSP